MPGGRGFKRNHAKQEDTREAAFTLRKQGKTFPEIGRELGISTTRAYEHVRDALAELRHRFQHSVDEYREMEIERMNRLEAALQAGIADGDPQSINAARQISDQRAKFLGLYAPVKIAPTNPEGTAPYAEASNAQIVKLLSKIAANQEEGTP